MKPSLLIVGLGNIGKEYENTRHNAGFLAIEYLKDQWGEGEWQHQPKWLAEVCEARLHTFPVLLVKPQTFMNRSGETVRKIVDFYKLDAAKQVLVLVDDLDIPLGDVRYRAKGSAGTHNGLKSIIAAMGTEFPRLRLGIGPKDPNYDLSAWVLSTFSTKELETLNDAIAELPSTIKEVVFEEI